MSHPDENSCRFNLDIARKVQSEGELLRKTEGCRTDLWNAYRQFSEIRNAVYDGINARFEEVKDRFLDAETDGEMEKIYGQIERVKDSYFKQSSTLRDYLLEVDTVMTEIQRICRDYLRSVIRLESELEKRKTEESQDG